MRWIIVFVVLIGIVFMFFMADRFPGILGDNQMLKDINSRIRDLLGMGITDPTYFPEHQLADTDAILKEEISMDAVVAACGSPPNNPWTNNTAPLDMEIEQYQLAAGIWEECKKKEIAKKTKLDKSPLSQKKSLKNQLQEYHE